MRSSPVINTFNAGELAPLMDARTDFDKYSHGCVICENANIYPQGSAIRRPPTKYIIDSKADDKIRMVPFTFNTSQAYHLEIGPLYIRFILNGEQLEDPNNPGNPLEVVTEYLEVDLPDIKFVQVADIMWIVHPDHPVSTLSRTDIDAFEFAEYDFEIPAFLPVNTTDTEIWSSATTGNVTLFASDDVFNPDHVGSVWKFSEPRTSDNQRVTGSTTVSGITDELYVAFSNWTVTTSRKWIGGPIVIQRKFGVGGAWEDYITLGDTSGGSAGTDERNFTASSDEPEPANSYIRVIVSTITSGAIGYEIIAESTTWDSVVEITGYTSATEVSATVISPFQYVPSDYSAWATSTAYAIGDKVSEGTEYYECTIAHTSGTFATDLSNGKWALRTPKTTSWQEGSWSDHRGYPSVVTFFENRLCLAATITQPNTVWLSETDNYKNFSLGTLDTDALEVTLRSPQVNEIKWLIPQELLLIGTAGSEWVLGPDSDENPVTPTAFSLRRKTTLGSSGVQSVLLSNAVLFFMREGKKLREYKFNITESNFQANDLTILSRHITNDGIVYMDYAQQPENSVYCIREDGQMAIMIYEPTQNVFGWVRFVTDGEFESVSIIPRKNEEDEVCVSVKRVIDGATVRYIEIFDKRDFDGNIETYNGQDSYTVFNSPATTTLTGLDYLEGKEVEVLRDGKREPRKIVESGSIEIENIGNRVVVGLPFTCTIAPMYIEPDLQGSQSMGMKKGIAVVRVRFAQTNYAKVGQTLDSLEDVHFRVVGDLLDSPVPLTTDSKKMRIDNSWEPIKTIYVVSDAPLPMTVVALIPDVEVKK